MKVLEGEPTFRCMGLHAEILQIYVVNNREGIKIKDYPLNDLSPFLGGFSPIL